MSARRRALFLVPSRPAPAGHGLAMRMGALLDGLARRFDVELAIAPLVATGLDENDDTAWLAARTTAVRRLELPRAGDARIPMRAHPGAAAAMLATATPSPWSGRGTLLPGPCHGLAPDAPERVAAFVAARRPDVLVVGRLYTAALLTTLLADAARRPPSVVVDLDDHDASVAVQLARLHLEAGRPDRATAFVAESRRAALLERAIVPQVDATFVAARDDVARIATVPRSGAHLHLPNTYLAPPTLATRAATAPVLLFVATLGFLPNEHGARWLANEILPRVRRARPDAELWLAGRRPGVALRRLERLPGVRLFANPGDVDALYRAAAIAVCPLAVGGGSRLKLLEAFAHGVPVVTTTRGADGLDLRAGEHALFADDPDAFADACLTLLRDDARAAALARAAHRLVLGAHAPANVEAALEAAWPS